MLVSISKNFFFSRTPEPIPRIKGSRSSYFAVALSVGSFLRQRFKNLRRLSDPPAMPSGGLLAIITIAIMGLTLKYRG